MKTGLLALIISCGVIFFSGCSGYTSNSLYPEDVKTIYVKMFDNTTFRRDLEYDLTDAIAKRIETDSPYVIVSSQNRADTVISGKIVSMSDPVLTVERETGRALENQAEVIAVFSWKNLKTGQYIVSNKRACGTASYSEFQRQGFDYASKVAANKLAERIVEMMQSDW